MPLDDPLLPPDEPPELLPEELPDPPLDDPLPLPPLLPPLDDPLPDAEPLEPLEPPLDDPLDAESVDASPALVCVDPPQPRDTAATSALIEAPHSKKARMMTLLRSEAYVERARRAPTPHASVILQRQRLARLLPLSLTPPRTPTLPPAPALALPLTL
jgi:hypothetical protein